MKKIFYVIIFAIFLLGVYLRLNLYIFDRPLWHDECSLAINILYKNFAEYFGVLAHNQSAPPLFMILTKIFCNIAGIKESVLRFLPLCSSLISIPVFYMVSEKILNRKISVVFANVLFSINYYLIYYCQEFKQYSTDVLLFLVAFLILSKIKLKDLSYSKTVLISIVMSLIVLLSLPSLFVIFAFLIMELYEDKKKFINKQIVFIFPVFITFITLYFSSLLPSKSSFLVSYWNSGFLTFDISRVLSLINTNLLYYFYPNVLVLFTFILVCLGIYTIAKDYKERNHLMLLTLIILIIMASACRLYPIMQRVSLYITPVLILLISKPIDFVSLNRKILSALILFLLILSLSSYNLPYFKEVKSQPNYQYDARSSMKAMKELYKNNDLILINAASDSEFMYYSAYYGLNTNNYVFVQTPNNEEKFYLKILDSLPVNQNIWFYYVNDYSHSPVIPFLKAWANNKKILDKHEEKNSVIMHVKT